MDHATELTRILTGLGDNADAVAASLKAAGIKGVRNTVRFLNPVIRYCQAQLTLDDYALDLIRKGVVRMVLPDGKKVLVQLPQSAKDFLDEFHNGNFPDLELPNT